ncbi:MAG TPA: hypothetical protein HPP76_04240 [Desulfuromonadales bacterium]|nr:hypothetical protein [Desulfuromonadales bacterium]
MEIREFASYGYEADGTMKKLVLAAIISGLVTMVCVANISPWFLFGLLIPIGIVIQIKRGGYSKPLVIGSRYLILGERIVYYRTITQARLDKEKQTLTITPHHGQPFVIAAEKFPTGARKDFKIKANRTAKFDKVSGRILERLNEASPEIVIL